jgi:predicted nuclease with TOPRIM domain
MDMLTQNDIKVIEEIVEEKIGEKTKLLPTKQEFFSKMDEVMGELKAIREEHVLMSGKVADNTDQLEDHDKRLTKIEKHAAATA